VPWNLSGGLLRYYSNCPVQIDQQQSLITLLLSTTTSADTNGDSSALWPEVIEDECGDEESEKDSSDTIADVIEIDIGRVTLKDAVESECDLQASITDPLASGRDPTRDRSDTGNKDDERCNRFHVRHEEHDGEARKLRRSRNRRFVTFLYRHGLSAPSASDSLELEFVNF